MIHTFIILASILMLSCSTQPDVFEQLRTAEKNSPMTSTQDYSGLDLIRRLQSLQQDKNHLISINPDSNSEAAQGEKVVREVKWLFETGQVYPTPLQLEELYALPQSVNIKVRIIVGPINNHWETVNNLVIANARASNIKGYIPIESDTVELHFSPQLGINTVSILWISLSDV